MSQQVNLGELFDAYKREDEVVVVPAGPYTLEVLRATVRQGQKGPGIMPVYKVLEGPYAGKTIMAGQFTASEAGRSIFFRQMKGFGLGEDFFRMASADADPMKAVANALVGRVVQVQITVRPWQGQDRNNIAIGGISLVRESADPIAAAAGTLAVAPAPVVAPTPVPAAVPQPVATEVPVQAVVEQVAPVQTAAPATPTTAVPPMPPLPVPGQGPSF